MIAQRQAQPSCQMPHNWHQKFLDMLPIIERQLRTSFSGLKGEARDEAVQEGLVNALVAYRRLYQRGQTDLAYPTVLGRFAAAQYRDGRRVAGRLNVRDFTSHYRRNRKEVQVERLSHFDEEEGCWTEMLVEDRQAGPAETQLQGSISGTDLRYVFPVWFSMTATARLLVRVE